MVRRNVRSLSPQQRADFVNAILELKRIGIYDNFVQLHGRASLIFFPPNSTRSIHGSSIFLSWHRYMILCFERELQRINPNVDLHYWDWTQDAANPLNSPIWSNDFMGPNGDLSDGSFAVKSGPFATPNWVCVDENRNPLRYADGRFLGALKRRFGNDAPNIPDTNMLNNATWSRPYDTAPFSQNSSTGYRNAIEGFLVPGGTAPGCHNLIHRWIGQTMRTNLAPNDPVFYLHHSMIDRNWQRYIAGNPSAPYLPLNGGPQGINIDDLMDSFQPFYPGVTSRQMLDISALGYSYDSLRS